MLRFTKTKRLITIIAWIAIAFLAIIKLPNLSQVINHVNQFNQPQAQIARSTPLLKAHQIQAHWGRKLNHTQTAILVYSYHDHKIDAHQQNEIDQSLTRLQRRHRSLGIDQINDLHTSPDSTSYFKAPDQTVETAQLHINHRAPVSAIYHQAQSQGLTVRLTSLQLLQQETTRRIIKDTTAITIVGLLLSCLIISIHFRSIFLPIISLITLLITDVASLSITANLALKKVIGFTNLTPIAILLITTIIGTFLNVLIYQMISSELLQHRDADAANHDAMVKLRKPFLTIGLTMIVILGIPIFFAIPQLKSLPAFGITFMILTIATLTIIPDLASQLGHELGWPGHYHYQPNHYRLWNRLTRLSLWKPIIGLIILLYTVIPLAGSYRDNLNYSLADYLPNNQAQRGNNQLQAHFTTGKTQPVTIWLHNSRPFNKNAQLQPLDQLTTKLQSMPGVNSVSSLTQPSGMPVRKYYLRHQLTFVNLHLNQARFQLNRIHNRLKNEPHKLKSKSLKAVANKLNHLQNLNGLNQHLISDRIGSSHGNAKLSRRITAYQQAVARLNQELSHFHDQLSTNLDSANNQLSNYQNQVQKLRTQLRNTDQQVKTTNHQLNQVYNYLDDLQNSTTAKDYYITPSQLSDTDFQQSLINFTSQSKQTTRLQIIFNQSPSTKYNQSRLNQLKSEIKTQLQGTNLSHDRIGISGQPVEQAQLQHGFKSGTILTLIISGTLFAIILMLFSRSILHPLGWLLSLGLSYLAGLQLTELIFSYAIGQRQFNWQILMITSVIVLGIGSLLLIPFSFSYRHHQPPINQWLLAELTHTGQQVRGLTWIVVAGAVSLCFGHEVEFIQIGLIMILTIIIFELVFPLLTSAWGRLSQTLPHSKI